MFLYFENDVQKYFSWTSTWQSFIAAPGFAGSVKSKPAAQAAGADPSHCGTNKLFWLKGDAILP